MPVANCNRPHTHYLDDMRKLHPEIAGMITRLHRLTGDKSWAVRRHAPGGGRAYYQIVKVDPSTVSGYRDTDRYQCFTGVAELRLGLSGLLAAVEEMPPMVTVICRHWQGRYDRESTSTGRILVNGRRLRYPDGSLVPALYDGCHHRTEPADVRRILTALGYSALTEIDVEAVPVLRKADLYDDAAPLWAIMDTIGGAS